jgi:hypothetical protein
MGLFSEYFHFLIDDVIVGSYGWVAFLAVLVWMMWWLKRDANRNKYAESIEWIFLEVKIDELSEKSPLAMEQIFAALHAIHQNFTWGEDLAGKTVLYMSCEIVSLGGQIAYIFKLPARFRTLFESAVFAQYSKAEIIQVEDYLRNLPHHFDPDHSDFDFWGSQWHKKKNNAYPIRTYQQEASFEHSAQETFVDPLSNVIEVMSNLQPYELMVYQLVIKPVNDDWKEHTLHLIDELKGVPSHNEESIIWKIVFFIPDLIAKILVEDILGVERGEEQARPEKPPDPSQMLHKTDVEKKVINDIQKAMGKIGFDVRIRTLYLAPKDKINKSLRIPEFVGAFRNFDDVNLNGFKPDIGHTWTEGPTYKLSESLEKPYMRMAKLTRQRHMLHNFTARSSWRGSGKTIMNTEELATVFHFPQTQYTRVSQIERVHTVKSAPPMDLPIA